MRIPYYRPYCDQHSTRRWNLEIHIKRRHGKSPGRYLASQPSYNRNVQSESDSIGNTFEPRYMPQLVPPRAQYFSGLIYPPMDDQRYATGLSEETKLKIEEFKRLMHKYSIYHTNPNAIITMAVYWSNKGDNKFLDEKLEQLRSMDSLSNRF